MRTVGLVALASVALVAPAWTQEVYRWQDGAGRTHYSNTPPADSNATRMGDKPLPYAATPPDAPDEEEPGDEAGVPPEGEPAAADDGSGGSAGIEPEAADAPLDEQEEGDASAGASLRRNELERDLRATESRLREIDGQLRDLAAHRTRYAHGDEATGGVRTGAADVRSEEEQALEAEREQLSKHAAEVRDAGSKLRQEVSGKHGSAPDWWVDLR